jgi:putative addiction module killer protein
MVISHYLTPKGVDPFQLWLDGLKDLKSRIAIVRRIDRMAAANFGDHKFISDGVWELRIDIGPGYRVYFSQPAKTVVLLLCGGSKRSQASDIKQAITYWNEFHRRES